MQEPHKMCYRTNQVCVQSHSSEVPCHRFSSLTTTQMAPPNFALLLVKAQPTEFKTEPCCAMQRHTQSVESVIHKREYPSDVLSFFSLKPLESLVTQTALMKYFVRKPCLCGSKHSFQTEPWICSRDFRDCTTSVTMHLAGSCTTCCFLPCARTILHLM